MVKGIKRLIPVLCCIVILISCMVVPASALGPSLDPKYPSTKIVPYLTGSMFYTTAASYDDEDRFGSSYRLADGSHPSETEYLATYANIGTLLNATMPDDGPIEWNIAQTLRTKITSIGDSETIRLHEAYRLVSADGSLSPLFPWAVTIRFESFGGWWDKEFLRSLFYLHGRYEFELSFQAFSVSNQELFSERYTFNGSANGDQSIFYGSWLDKVASDLNISDKQYYYFDNVTLKIPWGLQDQNLTISRRAARVGRFASSPANNPTAVYIDFPIPIGGVDGSFVEGSFYSLVNGTGLQTGPSVSYLEGGDITDFLAGSASSVLDAKLFGDFSLGGILAVILAVSIVFWLMKVFAGG